MWLFPVAFLGAFFVLTLLLIAAGNIYFRWRAGRQAEALLRAGPPAPPERVSEKDLARLPEPVRRFLRHSRIVGRKRIRSVYLRQRGSFRTTLGGKWIPTHAEQWHLARKPAFLWAGSMEPVPFLSVKARDRLVDGRGKMTIKLLGLFKVAEVSGPEMDRATLLRYLGEAVWFPTSFLEDYVQWEPVDDGAAKATISYGGSSVTGTLYVNEKGEATSFTGERHHTEGKEMILRPWSVKVIEYGSMSGLRIPTRIKAVWHLPSGDLESIDLTVTELRYNPVVK